MPITTLPAPADPHALRTLTGTEWLLTAGNGNFAMGTASGIPTRRYHGLLVASLRPPVARTMALSAIAETLTHDGQTTELATFNFSPTFIHPTGWQRLHTFERDARTATITWTYRVGQLDVVKRLHLPRLPNTPTALLRYTVRNPTATPATLTLAPLVALRDFHALLLRDIDPSRFTITQDGQAVTVSPRSGPALTLRVTGDNPPQPAFTQSPNWWYNFAYAIEASRGYDSLEDLYSPGSFTMNAPRGETSFTLVATLTHPTQAARSDTPPTFEASQQAAATRQDALLKATRLTLGPAFFPGGSRHNDPLLASLPALVAAADDFIVRRVRPGAAETPVPPADRVSIIAGYPWFADWGRDSMISLPGLLLACGRFTESRAVLDNFATAVADGLIPNVFDDYTGQPHYNTVDAALWFVHAATQHLIETGERDFFNTTLLPACEQIVDRYRTGTRFNIQMDPADGLISAGDETTQLTWMDAKRDGVVFTPRHGKAVEINALWHNALRALADAVKPHKPADTLRYLGLADRVAASFRAAFWNPARSALHDAIGPGGQAASELRPNQLLAVSLPHSPLNVEQQRAVVKACNDALLTPRAVRTLEPADPRYKGRFRGRMFERDAAYHNGTGWPWLLGPMAEATARADNFTAESVSRARAILKPTLQALTIDTLGQIPEVYDGDHTQAEPQQPGACPAQAWSVAEVLRVSILLARAEA